MSTTYFNGPSVVVKSSYSVCGFHSQQQQAGHGRSPLHGQHYGEHVLLTLMAPRLEGRATTRGLSLIGQPRPQSLCVISLDRFWCISAPIAYRQSSSGLRAVKMNASVWLISLVICVPPLLGWKKSEEERSRDDEQCEVSASGQLGYVIYSSLGSFFIPTVVILVLYARIYVFLRRRASQRRKSEADVELGAKRSESFGRCLSPRM